MRNDSREDGAHHEDDGRDQNRLASADAVGDLPGERAAEDGAEHDG